MKNATKCATCGFLAEGLVDIGTARAQVASGPKVGDAIICSECVGINVVLDGLVQRVFTSEDWARIGGGDKAALARALIIAVLTRADMKAGVKHKLVTEEG